MSDKVVNTDNLEEVKQVGVVIKLSRPITWDEVEYKELNLNFDSLSGDDIIDAESDFMDFVVGKKNVFVAFKDEHPAYLAVLAAKAAGIHPNFMKKLAGKDFLKVSGASKRFLNGLA
ncbi:hypothetical protein D3C76_51870 [compost metagenome]